MNHPVCHLVSFGGVRFSLSISLHCLISITQLAQWTELSDGCPDNFLISFPCFFLHVFYSVSRSRYGGPRSRLHHLHVNLFCLVHTYMQKNSATVKPTMPAVIMSSTAVISTFCPPSTNLLKHPSLYCTRLGL